MTVAAAVQGTAIVVAMAATFDRLSVRLSHQGWPNGAPPFRGSVPL
jgi:hypothetical protein